MIPLFFIIIVQEGVVHVLMNLGVTVVFNLLAICCKETHLTNTQHQNMYNKQRETNKHTHHIVTNNEHNTQIKNEQTK
jgi:hypothetical protein